MSYIITIYHFSFALLYIFARYSMSLWASIRKKKYLDYHFGGVLCHFLTLFRQLIVPSFIILKWCFNFHGVGSFFFTFMFTSWFFKATCIFKDSQKSRGVYHKLRSDRFKTKTNTYEPFSVNFENKGYKTRKGTLLVQKIERHTKRHTFGPKKKIIDNYS